MIASQESGRRYCVIIDRGKALNYYDADKFTIRSFRPEGKTEPVRWFTWSGTNLSVPSRSQIGGRREPFMVPPEIQILIDNSQVYGSKVDKDIEDFVQGKHKSPETMLQETLRTIENIEREGLVWVDRSVMVCHPDGLISGEIDELLYDPQTDTYFVGDTKTSSSVDKLSYWWQIAVYVQILKELNPDKNISAIGVINHVRYKYFKWECDRSVVDSQPSAESIKPDHPRYNIKWSKGETYDTPILDKSVIVKRDLELEGIMKMVKDELRFIKEVKDAFPDQFKSGKFVNNLQTLFDNTTRDDILDFYRLIDIELQRIYNEKMGQFQ